MQQIEEAAELLNEIILGQCQGCGWSAQNTVYPGEVGEETFTELQKAHDEANPECDRVITYF